MRYAQNYCASVQKYVNYSLLLHLECCKCARMRFHPSNGPVVLHMSAPQGGTLLVVRLTSGKAYYFKG